MGMCALSAYRGDLALARRRGRRDIPMLCSGTGLIPLEEVRRANEHAWFQAYVPGEPARIEALIDRVARGGYGTLVVTADTAVSGNRENHVRVGFPARCGPACGWPGTARSGRAGCWAPRCARCCGTACPTSKIRRRCAARPSSRAA
jgi:L-lactate dehydrogenase (cytochrome)